MVYQTTKLQKASALLAKQLPRIFSPQELRSAADQVKVLGAFGDATMYRARRAAKKVPLVWGQFPSHRLLTFSERIELLDIVSALTSERLGFYVSHFSALYWNELIDQQPTTYYLSREIQGRKPKHTETFDPELVKWAFMKEPRQTTRAFRFKKTRIFMVEKQDLGNIGVVSKNVSVEDGKASICVTGVERTLIDSVVSPHYSGGLLTVMQAMRKADLNLDQLLKIYRAYDPLYPYWQVIGFLLNQTQSSELAARWKANFKRQLVPFYASRGYREDWPLSKEWNVYYPQGLLS